MVRLRDDVEGCGCIRCQGVDHTSLHSSVAGAFAWGCRFPLARPSVLLVFAPLVFLQVGASMGPAAVGIGGALLGVVGVFVGRGYIGLMARDSLGNRHVTARSALTLVVRRLPAFVGATLFIIAVFAAMALFVRTVGSPVARAGLGAVGLEPVTVDLALLVLLAGSIVYVLIRLCFVPEACFVGGYGPLDSVRVSWTLTNLRPRTAAALVAGYGLLLAAGVFLDQSFAGSNQPVLLSFRYHDTVIVLRSFGLSMTSGVRLTFDVLVTAVYSGVFAHQYVQAVFEW